MLPRAARAVLHLEIAPRMDEERDFHHRINSRLNASKRWTRLNVILTGALIFATWYAQILLVQILAGAIIASGVRACWLVITTVHAKDKHICFDHQAFWAMRVRMLR